MDVSHFRDLLSDPSSSWLPSATSGTRPTVCETLHYIIISPTSWELSHLLHYQHAAIKAVRPSLPC
jgi:hypothetical protein